MPRYSKPKPKPRYKKSLLPLWLSLAGLTLLLIAGFVLWNNNATTKTSIRVKGGPSLEVEKDIIDHGKVKLGVPIYDTVRVTNVGDQPLRFDEAPYIEVIEGCWPPTPVIGSMILQPGESTSVNMEYLMHGEMGGPHDFRLHLKTNDKTQPDKVVDLLSNWVQ